MSEAITIGHMVAFGLGIPVGAGILAIWALVR